MYENILLLDLNHEVPITPQGRHIPKHIDSFLGCDSLQHGVHNNKSTSSSNTSAAMNDLEEKRDGCITAQFQTSKNVYNHIVDILTFYDAEFAPLVCADASFVVFVTLCVWNTTKQSL